ncbi:MAG: bifunctional phosphoribosylaminoimidazolecarboxamide formyltransferase/IMP cyclohydrolase [Anaerolineaceae bacterium]|nr:bifunctional phosphoribosylaminoimidazolecarboxamide formyltransferase/IMP cyclohydrolase [Anaerolineaceae bacterium]
MPKAILSVSDKTNLIPFAAKLSQSGWTLLASGGTAKLLSENNIPVTEISKYTSSPEILDGRVKTLHPAIHGGILAQDTPAHREDLAGLGIDMIDLVVCNLYPFQETIAKENVKIEEAIENIDIGGVTLLRAAAKNYQRVSVLCDIRDYDGFLKKNGTNSFSVEDRYTYAVKAFQHTATYDAAIATYLSSGEFTTIPVHKQATLRYGENPHQEAEYYTYSKNNGPLGGKFLQGKELSYNNYLDLDAALRSVISFDEPTVVIVKHLSPCGIASANKLHDAYQQALASDPVSAFGSVIASNRAIDIETAQEIKKLFVECIIAPGYDETALELLQTKKNCRIIEMPNLMIEPAIEYRSVNMGLLRQDIDYGDPKPEKWQVVTSKKPTAAEMESLHFAWKACQHVKSNAIVFVSGKATIGIGGGQPNRVDCVQIAAQRAGEKSNGAVMASDAFFPFADSVEHAAKFGITAIVQPGGSKRDIESIEMANRLNIAMVFTGVRHFKH